ncbi:MAG: PAS domain S-box protein [Deltaproteobacteria bacterium]|nr:PAS domain S-box protein [Deltaproteobacteria bacterium]
MIALSGDLNIVLREEELVHRFVQATSELLPGRLLSVRLVDPLSLELTLVYATGRLEPGRRESASVSTSALDDAGMDPGPLVARSVRVTDRYELLLSGSRAGFDLALHQAGHFYGILNVEYAEPVTLPNGDHEVVVALSQLLASSLRNAQVLRETQYLREYLEKLLDNANAAIMVVGPDRKVQVVNRALERLVGDTREGLVGRDLLNLLPETERHRVQGIFSAALRREPSSNVEVQVFRKGGGVARLALNTAAILSPEHDVEGVVAVGHDLTEIRELQEKIIQSEKLATLGQFAAGIVHELNNPLTSISVYADYLIKKQEREHRDPADVEKTRRILQGAERILRFTRDLMSYARPSAEEVSRIDLHKALDQALVFCEHLVEESRATVVRDYAENLPPIWVVESQLHQVLINLITNACQAMPDGNGRLVLTTEMGPAGQVVLQVSDNGCGIAAEDLESVFEPFFTTKAEGKGTGLGLSIVKNIVRSHDGHVEVSSEPGCGTTFTVTLSGPRA